MSRFRPGRVIGVTVGTLVILLVGVYGPATLLGPLPAATVTLTEPDAAPAVSAPVLPTAGTSAVIALSPASEAETAADTGNAAAEPILAGGTADALPMASAAKIITALVVLDAKPLAVGEAGPAYSLVTADYQDYLDYAAEGARTVVVFPGESWSQREMLQALILGSSNNHADTIARWAFGSVEDYLAAAQTWLTENGLADTAVVDTTGLADESVGTGTDLARLAGLAAANPTIADILAQPASALVGQRGVNNTTAYLPEEGIVGISRSYTDAGGVCFLFTATVDAGENSFSFAGAMVGEPDYDTLTADLTALMASARAGVTELPVLADGAPYAALETAWGESAQAVVGTPKTRFGWQAAEPGEATVVLDDVTTGRAGTNVGRVTVDAFGDSVSSTLELDQTLSAPGAGWRLLHPFPLIGAWIDSQP